MKKDFKYIQEKFSNDGIHAPEQLSEEHLRRKLPLRETMGDHQRTSFGFSGESVAEITQPRRKRTMWRGATAVAACLLIAVMVLPAAHDRLAGKPNNPILMEGDGLYSFHSYHEIQKLVKTLNRNEKYSSWTTGGLFRNEEMAMVEDAEEAPLDAYSQSASDSASAGETGSVEDTVSKGSENSHSSTYLQVQDVDEADIIKTDDKYIYYVNNNSEIFIYSADEGETRKVAELGSGQGEYYYSDIYLKEKEQLLVTVGAVYENEERFSAVVIYDISDRNAPEKVGEFRQSGEIVSSRMVGKYVYLVTRENADNTRYQVPKVMQDGVLREMELSDICSVPEPKSASYIVLSSVDVTSGESVQSKTKAIFGASEDIYCNNDNLYMAAQEYNEKTGETNTRIVRASLDGAKVRFEATGVVSGNIIGQFAMDEKEGCFRVATTLWREGMVEVNNLYVLDQNLKEMGRLTGFARNESIRAVRYIGEKAYIITFRQVDPLFVIDLSNPSKPVIEGEVQIDGFSSMLVPVKSDRLLGIGYLTKDNGYGGVYTDGLKLALFDVSDPAHPTVLDSKEFSGINSPAQETHLALTVNDKEGYFAIPYNSNGNKEVQWIEEDDISEIDSQEENLPEKNDAGDSLNSGILVFSADDEIRVNETHALSNSRLQRGVYIGDWFYALDNNGNVYSFAYHQQSAG